MEVVDLMGLDLCSVASQIRFELSQPGGPPHALFIDGIEWLAKARDRVASRIPL